MGAFRLSDKQWDELDRLRFSAGDAKVFRNCLIILMSDRGVGRSRRSIAKELAQMIAAAPITSRSVQARSARVAGFSG